MWGCELNRASNRIYITNASKSKTYGYYPLIPPIHCERCSYPNVTTESHINMAGGCKNLYGLNKVYAVGFFSSKADWKEGDLLGKHILRLKDYGNLSYAEPLGLSMAIVLKEIYDVSTDYDYIVPVPVHTSELSPERRGFNQSEKISEILAREIDIPYVSVLKKVKDIQFQYKDDDGSRFLSRDDREEEIKGAFESEYELEGENLLLVDDILTTGFTASECSQTLIDAGAKSVDVIVAGREVFKEDYDRV